MERGKILPVSQLISFSSHSIFLVNQKDEATFIEKRMIDFPSNPADEKWDITVEKFNLKIDMSKSKYL